MVLTLEDIRTRGSCLGIAYNLSSSLFGGTAPLIASAITAATGGPRGAGIYLSVVTWFSVSAIVVADRLHRRRAETHDVPLAARECDPEDGHTTQRSPASGVFPLSRAQNGGARLITSVNEEINAHATCDDSIPSGM